MKLECECHSLGGKETTCRPSGDCACNSGYTGSKCDICDDGYYTSGNTTSGKLSSTASCSDCMCNVEGSLGKSCSQGSGTCNCKPGYVGDKCDDCDINYYKSTTTCIGKTNIKSNFWFI